MKTFTDTVKNLLGKEYEKLESASLKHSKFLTLGDNAQKEGLQKVVEICKENSKPMPSMPFDSSFELTLGGRLAINMATGVLENAGLSLHRHFNIPQIPGSALKGIARHQAWIKWKAAEGDKKKSIGEKAERIFGSPIDAEDPKANCKGSICFLPAYPKDKDWSLAVDVLTPHGGNDYTNPVPCFFLTVEKGACFTFYLKELHRAKGDINQAEEWLKSGLISHGAGAKTIAGYGCFDSSETHAPITLTLASPGFFAGAFQYDKIAKGDCTLRASSLRGMLRWWWRALYRDYLPKDKDQNTSDVLKKLEDFLWGSTEKSGIIQTRISADREYETELFNDKIKEAQRHNISGLHYLAYGMNETKQRRYYCQPDSSWKLTFSLRNNQAEYQFPPDGNFSGPEILEQASVALSLLCRYGGVGAKARKGFGSLCWEGAKTLEDCQKIATELCKKLETSPPPSGVEYGMKSVLSKEISIPHADPWKILNTIGLSVQDFAANYKNKKEMAVLGLPRKKNPRRFASPLWIHLNTKDKGIVVRLTAFPSGQIGKKEDSRTLLKGLISSIEDELNAINWKEFTPPPTILKKKNPNSSPSISIKSSEKRQAVLLEERTKKGRWRARIVETDIEGVVINSEDVEGEVGDEITVKIQSHNPENASFNYIKEDQ